MGNALHKLFDAIKDGTSIDITVVDLTDGANPLATSDAYLRVMQDLAKLKRIEQLARDIYEMLSDVGRKDQAEGLRIWLNSLSEPIDVALDQLEREREHSGADVIEKEMAGIADSLGPIIDHSRKMLKKITERHRRALASVDFSDLLVPVPNVD